MAQYYKGNLAYALPERKEEPKKRQKPAKNVRARAMTAFFVVFAVLFSLVLKYASLVEANARVYELKKEYTRVSGANDQSRLRLESEVDLKKIEADALELGMIKPQGYQIEYVSVKRN